MASVFFVDLVVPPTLGATAARYLVEPSRYFLLRRARKLERDHRNVGQCLTMTSLCRRDSTRVLLEAAIVNFN
jgi:hypothetical protein